MDVPTQLQSTHGVESHPPSRWGAGSAEIVDEDVIGITGRLTFIALSITASILIALFAWAWVTLPGFWAHPVLDVLTTLIIAYFVALAAARWWALMRMTRPGLIEPAPGWRVAAVTAFVPSAEPIAMLEQTLQALVRQTYPHDTWVLDEGNDATVRELCRRLGVQHFSRNGVPALRTETGRYAARSKHGNYNAWLDRVGFGRYDVIVMFDPDHVPEPEYVARVLGFFRDPTIGYVQAPEVYYNQEASFIARGAAEEGFAYYSSQQMASYALGHPVITGCHTAHRVAALREVGGLPAHDAEDLVVTMRYRAAGWRGVYLPSILAMGITPVDWSGYLRQQLRWSRAVLDLKFRHLPRLAGQLSPLERVLNLLHGAYFLRALTLPVLYIMLVVVLVTNTVPVVLSPMAIVSLLALACVFQLMDLFRQHFYLDPRHERGIPWRARILQFAKWPVLVRALWDVAWGRRVPFVLTAKVDGTRREWVLAPPHLLVATVIAIAWGIGTLRHGPLAPILSVLAAVVVGASLLLVWTESWDYPPPYDVDAFRRRRAEMADVLGG